MEKDWKTGESGSLLFCVLCFLPQKWPYL